MISLPLTRPQLESIRATLDSRGISLTGDSGTVKRNGAIVEYKYDESAQILTVEVLVKPILLSREMIEERVKQWFDEAMKEPTIKSQ